MNETIKNLKGSPKRDVFKHTHKQKISRNFYASDADLCLVSFNPRGVVAYLDYKGSEEEVTASEEILYDEWSKSKPVFIIKGADPENGPFKVYSYFSGKPLKPICKLRNWKSFEVWEASVRKSYSSGS